MKEAKPDYAQGEAGVAARAIADSGGWEPFVDWSSTCPGNRGVNREGRYELYDAPIGIAITIHQQSLPSWTHLPKSRSGVSSAKPVPAISIPIMAIASVLISFLCYWVFFCAA